MTIVVFHLKKTAQNVYMISKEQADNRGFWREKTNEYCSFQLWRIGSD
jgi:hypothetical protein